MSDKEHIKALIREAGIYRKQGLYPQARDKYTEVFDFVKSHEWFSKDKKLIESLRLRLKDVEEEVSEVDRKVQAPELSSNVQRLIRNLFSFSKNEETAAIEGAVALAKFGQYEKAVEEFRRLIREGIQPFSAAKNLLKCHLSLSSSSAVLAQFKQWEEESTFSGEDLDSLRKFLQNVLSKTEEVSGDIPAKVKEKGGGVPGKEGEIAGGMPVREEDAFPSITEVAPEALPRSSKDENRDESIELLTVGLLVQSGPQKGKVVEFDVTYQTGNTLSVIIPSENGDVADGFKFGVRLDKIRCSSSQAVFTSSGIISGNTEITSGPKKGDFALDITIDDPQI